LCIEIWLIEGMGYELQASSCMLQAARFYCLEKYGQF